VLFEISELESLAAARLDQMAYDYTAGGGDEEITVASNLAAWRSLRLRPHVLRDVSQVTTATTLLGTPVSTPIVISPTAMHRLFCADGERETARAARAVGALYIVSISATTSLEDIAAAAPSSPRWMQMYIQQDRGLTRDLCARVKAAGYEAVVLTVDSPVLVHNARNRRNNFNVPSDFVLPNLVPSVAPGSLDIYSLVTGFDAAVTFDDIAQVSEWAGGLPVVVKGVLRGDDAARCVEAGAAAISVSNHGGRQLDNVIPTARALPEIVDAVGDRAEVYVDGGIRRGHHALMALALGARAVFLGRSVVWSLAVAGESGARFLLEELTDELRIAMAMCGLTSPEGATRDLLDGIS
jgi:4-hydroxymandelate oxidase